LQELNRLDSAALGVEGSGSLGVRFGVLPDNTILPGIHVERGELVVDDAKLLYPGDLLHEAGHLAVMPAAQRTSIDGDTGDDGGQEMAAMAWSYAAALQIGIPPEAVFHPAGYRGGSEAYLAAFRDGATLGTPYLKWIGLAGDDFPRMVRWVLD
jgi:hypothetical protein